MEALVEHTDREKRDSQTNPNNPASALSVSKSAQLTSDNSDSPASNPNPDGPASTRPSIVERRLDTQSPNPNDPALTRPTPPLSQASPHLARPSALPESLKLLSPEEGYVIGFNVERLRRRAGISKVRFCEMLGIGRPTLDRIEDGEHDIRLGLLVRIAEALEVRAVDLMTMPQHYADVNARKVLQKRQEERREKGARKVAARKHRAKAANKSGSKSNG